MKSINISKKAFDKLEELQLPNEVLSSESKLYIYNFRGQQKLVKKLYKTNGEYFATKLYTVAMLDECKENLPDNFVIPDYTLSIGHENVGFTVPKVNGITLSSLLIDVKIDPQEQVDYLKQIGGTIRQLESIRKYTGLKSIFLNDINESNFVVTPNNRELYVIDLDSVKIESNKIFPARYLSKRGLLSNVPEKYIRNEKAWATQEEDEYDTKYRFAEGFYIPDANTDLYCYCIIILNYLYGGNINNMKLEEFYEYLNYLTYIGVNKELVECLRTIVNTRDNYNPADYLDSLTTENIVRAKQKIFNLNRKKNVK